MAEVLYTGTRVRVYIGKNGDTVLSGTLVDSYYAGEPISMKRTGKLTIIPAERICYVEAEK